MRNGYINPEMRRHRMNQCDKRLLSIMTSHRNRERARHVYMFDADFNLVKEFASAEEAANFLGASKTKIRWGISNQKTVNNFYFSFTTVFIKMI